MEGHPSFFIMKKADYLKTPAVLNKIAWAKDPNCIDEQLQYTENGFILRSANYYHYIEGQSSLKVDTGVEFKSSIPLVLMYNIAKESSYLRLKHSFLILPAYKKVKLYVEFINDSPEELSIHPGQELVYFVTLSTITTELFEVSEKRLESSF